MTETPRIRIYANRWFAKFAAKEKISDATLADAVHLSLIHISEPTRPY